MSNYKLLSIILILTSTLISAEELFEPLKDFFKEFETLSADFTQTLLNEDGEQIEKDHYLCLHFSPKPYSSRR